MDHFRFGPDPAIELNGTVLDAGALIEVSEREDDI